MIAWDCIKILLDPKLGLTRVKKILLKRFQNGASNGNLLISGNPSGISEASAAAYTSLELKGWFIDVDEPPVTNIQQITFTTTSSSANWSPQSVVNSGNTLSPTIL